MAKSVNLKNLDVKTLLKNVGKNLAWIFFGAFVVLVILELIEINHSAQIVVSSGKEPAVIIQPKGVRINFNDYDSDVQRIQNAQFFTPSSTPIKDPFSTGQ